MNALRISILVASVASSAGTLAKEKPSPPQGQAATQLDRALGAVAAAVDPPGQSNRKVDPDQGDDHASDRAILRVCSKDTPAAQRSAICPAGVSPN